MVDVKTSKALSWILRHGAEKEGLTVLSGGWVALLDVLKKPNFKKVTLDDVKRIVENCSKQRFSLKEEDGQFYIKANQGHSIQIDASSLEEITSDKELKDVIHGTYYNHWDNIQKKGLSRMRRMHIHFAPGLPGEAEVISGLRQSCQIYIYINFSKAIQAGFKFYKSENNVILCPGNDEGYLPPEYFLKVVDKNTGKDILLGDQ